MAYKKSSKIQRASKIEPSVQTLTFITTATNTTATDYIDLSQVASLLNRRFYRQGLNWAVAGFKFLRPSGFEGSVRISKLPNTWVLSNSWEKSMRTWLKMTREAMEETPSVRPRFLDFKIYADAEHHAAGFAGNLLPISSFAPGTYQPGEWESAKLRIPVGPANPGDTTEREIVAVGANYPGNSPVTGINAVSMIEGYAASRGLPDVLEPNAPGDAASAVGTTPQNWMSAVFNEGTEQDSAVIQDMISENNISPYPFENDGVNTDTQYPGGANQGVGLQIHDLEYITPTTIGGTTRLKGGNFPCGLIQIQSLNLSVEPLSLVLQIDLIPGNHRGYLCEPMTEM